MNPQQTRHDDGAQPGPHRTRTGGAHRITFGPFALLVGTAVTHVLLAAVVGLTFGAESAWHAFSVAVMAAILGIPISVAGCGVALVLGLALRRIAHQGLHVAAFFGVFALLAALITLAGGSGPGALLMGAAVGVAAAAGRASVWKLVTIQHGEAETSRAASR